MFFEDFPELGYPVSSPQVVFNRVDYLRVHGTAIFGCPIQYLVGINSTSPMLRANGVSSCPFPARRGKRQCWAMLSRAV